MNILDAVTNVASGGVLGLVGTIGSGVVSIFQAKNQYTHDEHMADLNLKLVAAQSDAASRLSADQLKTMSEQQAGQAFTASQVAGGQINNVNPVIAGILSLWRPLLTSALTALSVYLYQTTTDLEMKAFIIKVSVQSWSMALAWWWGSRQIEKFVASKPVPNPAP